MFPARWYRMKSTRDVHNYYALCGTQYSAQKHNTKILRLEFWLVSKHPCVNRSLPWLTWRQSIYTVLAFSRRISVSIVKTRPHPILEGLIMTYTTIIRKMTGQKTRQVLCRSDSVGFTAILVCCQQQYTTHPSSNLLSLKEHWLYGLQCYLRHVRTMLCTTLRNALCNNSMDFQYDSATVQICYS